ncbi:hypothetical protein [Myxococcus xanthus]|nr:hypothetical protein [Myxococcus xanthus]
MRPGNSRGDSNLSMFDQGSDNRNFFQRMSGQPTPIRKGLKVLEG